MRAARLALTPALSQRERGLNCGCAQIAFAFAFSPPLPEGEGLNCGCVQIAFAFSPLSLWERARVRVFGHKKRHDPGGVPSHVAGSYQASALEASQNSVADRAMVAGKVRTQAIRMVLIVPPCRPLLFATIVPATPDDKICVVDTGSE